MTDRDHALNMVKLARRDLKALHGMLDSDVFAEEIFGFHAQQTVEKALKALIASRGTEYPLTHNLVALFQLLQDHGDSLTEYRVLADLSVFAVRFRYEGGSMDQAVLDRKETIADIERLLCYVQNCLQP